MSHTFGRIALSAAAAILLALSSGPASGQGSTTTLSTASYSAGDGGYEADSAGFNYGGSISVSEAGYTLGIELTLFDPNGAAIQDKFDSRCCTKNFSTSDSSPVTQNSLSGTYRVHADYYFEGYLVDSRDVTNGASITSYATTFKLYDQYINGSHHWLTRTGYECRHFCAYPNVQQAISSQGPDFGPDNSALQRYGFHFHWSSGGSSGDYCVANKLSDAVFNWTINPGSCYGS